MISRLSDGGLRLDRDEPGGGFRSLGVRFSNADARPLNISTEYVTQDRYNIAGINLSIEEAGEVIAALTRLIQEAINGTT